MKNCAHMSMAQKNAILLIRQYLRECPPIYGNDEKDTHYRFAVSLAMRDIRYSEDTPLNVLYDSQRKYDEWAHQKRPTSYIYSIAANAIDDLIDYILSAT